MKNSTKSVSNPFKIRATIHHQKQLVFGLFFAAIMANWLRADWFFADLSFFAGLLLWPYLMIFRQKKDGAQWIWAILSTAAFLMSFWLAARTIHFFAWGFAVLFAVSFFYGKMGVLPAILLAAISNLMKNWLLVFSFPIRLKMSVCAANLLKMNGLDVVANGNLIVKDGQPFAVDPACMGLSMLQISFLMYLFLLGFFERKTGRRLSFLKILVGFGVVILLNLSFNLIRIIALVLGEWPPETLAHEAVGLVGWLIYVVAPIYFFLKFWTKTERLFSKKASENGVFFSKIPQKWSKIALLSLVLMVGYLAFFQTRKQNPTVFSTISLDLPTHQKTRLEDGITKYDDGKTLIYTKPIRGFFDAEHSPLVCWRGAGYEISAVRIEKIGPREVFTGILKKGNSELPTAWWYANGTTQTIEQLEWRRRDLLGEPAFSLVNVTAAKRGDLLERVEKLTEFRKN